MRKFFLAVVAVCVLANLSAQDTIPASSVNPLLYNYTASSLNNLFNTDLREGASNRISIDFDYAANSNSVPVMFAYKMIFKGEITQKLKDRGSKRMKAGLRFEDLMKAGITYRHYFKKWDGEIFVGYHHRQTRNISAPKDAYQLLFYGNARFEDDTLDLSNIAVHKAKVHIARATDTV